MIACQESQALRHTAILKEVSENIKKSGMLLMLPRRNTTLLSRKKRS